MKLYVFNGTPFFEKKDNYDKPAGIAIAMPSKFFEDYPGGEDTFRRTMSLMNEHDIVWNQTISGIPTLEVPYVYFVFHGKVQYRLSIAQYERKKTKEFEGEWGVRRFDNKNWVQLVGPVVPAPSDFFMRGFQGFRYTELIF